jgi:heterodisulfide reductase subunit A
MDSITAIEQGIAAAHDISRLLKGSEKPSKKNIAILGRGEEGRKVSSAMADGEYNIILLDEETNDYENNKDITIHSGCRLKEISGTVGQFHISAESEDNKIDINVAALIVANGIQSKSLSSEKLIPRNDSVISLSQFHQNFNNYDELPENISFWMDHIGPEWKENSRKILLLAVDLRDKGKDVTIIMEKMLVHGLEGQRIYDRARKSGVKFLRVSSPPDVNVKQEETTLKINVKEATLSGIMVNVPCDLLIVPETVQPCSNNTLYADLLDDIVDEEGFMQSPNIRHRRTGSPRRGIFFAGSCHDETDESDLEHEIRVIKASIDLITSDSVESENTAVIDKGKCARCLTCFRICPHHAIILDDQQPFIKKEACLGCGLCVSSCPSVAIFKERDTDAKEQEKSLSETIVFACERSAFLAEKDFHRENPDINGYTVIPIDCVCSLDTGDIMEYLLIGAARIMVMGCHKDNCRSMIGDRHAHTKISRVLNETGISSSVLTYHPVAANESVRLGQLIKNTISDQKEATHG